MYIKRHSYFYNDIYIENFAEKLGKVTLGSRTLTLVCDIVIFIWIMIYDSERTKVALRKAGFDRIVADLISTIGECF